MNNQYCNRRPGRNHGNGTEAAADDQVKRVLRVKHYSIRTEKSYCYWIRFFIRYSGMRHPAESGAERARFSVLRVLDQPLGDIGEVTRARRRSDYRSFSLMKT